MSRIKLKTLSNLLPVSKITKTSAVSKAPAVISKRQLVGRIRDRKRHELWLESGGKCQSCERAVFGKGEIHLDHIVPLSQGGTDDDDNLQILCVPCHEEKTKAELTVDGKQWSGRFY